MEIVCRCHDGRRVDRQPTHAELYGTIGQRPAECLCLAHDPEIAPAKAGVADFSDKIMRKIKEKRKPCRFNVIEKCSKVALRSLIHYFALAGGARVGYNAVGESSGVARSL
jgi:hypothetical protein